jgi:DNA/RNA endonuclease YhcR with UshA esterase domain
MKGTLLIALGIAACGILAGAALTTFHTQQADATALRPGTVAPGDAQYHVGQTITVEGTVSEVHIADRATFLNMGGAYPDEEFTGVIFPDYEKLFPSISGLEGRTIDITGTVKLYRGRPEIDLTSADQIRAR